MGVDRRKTQRKANVTNVLQLLQVFCSETHPAPIPPEFGGATVEPDGRFWGSPEHEP